MSSWVQAGVTVLGEKLLWTAGLLMALAGGSAVATFAQSRALVDFWLIWVLVDLVGVPLAVKSGLYVSGAAYGIFFVMVIAGFHNWLKEYRRQRRSAELEAVPV